MMDRQSLPRFIRTQGGDYLGISHIRSLRCVEAEDNNPFDDDGPHHVVADTGAKHADLIGTYENKTAAKDALEWIMAQVDTPDSGTVFAPPREVTREAGE